MLMAMVAFRSTMQHRDLENPVTSYSICQVFEMLADLHASSISALH